MAVTDGLDYMPLEGRLGSAAMEGSSNASGVTPLGVREGDRVALQALVDRRGPAVVAFCMQVCGPQAADRAAAEAFARFRAAVRDAPDLRHLDPEALLRGATRHAAASMARQPSGPPPHGRLRSRGTQTCEHVPTMLAARANGALGEADLERLARHLDRCERCDALGEIFRRAELAYQDPVVDTLGSETTTLLMEALTAVSEQGVGTAPAPAGDGPAGEPLDGAFGHLPDLDDEIPLEPEAPAEPEPQATQALPAEAIAAGLAVEHVAEPADELDPVAVAAEPLPDAAPPVPVIATAGAYDDLEPGETIEWDELPEVAGEHAPAAPVAPLLEGGRERRSGAPRALVIALPVVLLAALVAGALALTGVFGGSDGTPAVERSGPVGIQAPVTTPLPVTVKVTPPPAATPAAGTAGTAASGTAASSAAPAGTGAGTASGTSSSTTPGTP